MHFMFTRNNQDGKWFQIYSIYYENNITAGFPHLLNLWSFPVVYYYWKLFLKYTNDTGTVTYY